MKKLNKLLMIIFLFSILIVNFSFAELPSRENYILQQWGFASGNDPANSPTSTNYILTGIAIGIISDEDATSSNYGMLPGYYLGPITGGILPPENVTIIVVGSIVQLSWTAVSGATSYKVYSSDDPYTGFTEDTSGTFINESWSAPAPTGKKFYYVKAVN